MNNLIMFASIAILSQVHGEIPNSISCTSKQCYTAFEITADFQTALHTCQQTQGHLITVRSSASNDAMRDLIADVKGEFWIGLKFNGNGCTDTSSRLRLYEWITGDTLTDFTNWKKTSSESFCTPMCVSVSVDLKWKERPCDDKIDGFLCEKNVCDPLQTDESAHYITPFGNEGDGATWFPPGSMVTGKSSGIRHICMLSGNWLRAPWFCEVVKGGCEHDCVKNNGKSQCTCPAGQALQNNNVTCATTQNDPCVSLGCEHICLPSESSCLCRDGYELLYDGKGCRDIDECRDKIICPNSNCVNTIGSYECNCAAGFKKENGICVDIDECFLSPCEHVCENTEGSYECLCFEGHIQSIDDHTKCKFHCDKRECQAKCDINEPTVCVCPAGFVVDIVPKDVPVCVDINECDTNFCSHGCTNNFGSYICSCPAGFKLIDGGGCEKYGPGSTAPPLDTVTPTSNSTTDYASAVTPGGLLGITVCVVLMILIIVFLVHQISSRSSWNCMRKNQGEDMQDLQQVTTQKHTDKSSFVNRNLKQDT